MKGGAYSAEAQQRPLTTASKDHHRHTGLAATTDKRPAVPLVRDKEAAASNQATRPNSRSPLTCDRLGLRPRREKLAATDADVSVGEGSTVVTMTAKEIVLVVTGRRPLYEDRGAK